MAHRICCPRKRDVETPDLPSRPHVHLDGALDSVLTMGVLPSDHPHGWRSRLSPVDCGILKSPKIADKIKLKMSKKSSRALRKELDRITDGPYEDDAHALTSTSIVNATEAHFLGVDGTTDLEHTTTFINRTPERFGTIDEEIANIRSGRPALYSPSVYSRSQSRADGETLHRNASSSTRQKFPHDFWGLYYRFQLPRKPSTSMNNRRAHSRQTSRHLSASTDSTITRRLEQSGAEYPYNSLFDPASYYEENDYTFNSVVPNTAEKTEKTSLEQAANALEHKRHVSEHRERV